MYLVDTNILSDIRRKHTAPLDWLRSVRGNRIFVSVITIGEIKRGVALKDRADPIAAASLDEWLQLVRQEYSDLILPVSERVALEWGRLSAQRSRSTTDGLIAATAIVHDLILVTRNTKDFDDLPITLINPWDR